MTITGESKANGAHTLEFDVIIVGAGFGGCYLLKLLRDQGLRVKVLDANNALGGVWAQNRYPGARVDIELPWYGYSDPAIWNTWEWEERFPDHVELRRYFRHVAKVWDLDKDITLNTKVAGAAWNEATNSWRLETSEGTSYQCRWFIAATGTSYRSYTPDWRGKELFEGHLHHSTAWPEDLDMTGKRVAVIGAGASGVQIVQEAAKVAANVTQYIRTPNTCLPMRQRKISAEERYQVKSTIPFVIEAAKSKTIGALAIASTGRHTFDDTPEQREAVYEEQWRRGGFNWSFGCYDDYAFSKEANEDMYNFWAKKVRARITDPKKRDLLAPLQAPYYIITKRPSLEQDYYEQCDKPHVEITNSPIQEFNKSGIISEDGTREFDIVAVATGFDAVSGGLRTMGVKGRGGIDLHDYWKDGVKTSLGMMTHSYPNMFSIYGPQSPCAYTNGPPFIELQCDWIAETISKQREAQFAVVEAKKEAEDAWVKLLTDIANATLMVKTDSWYMGANVPGKKRELLVFPGGVPLWHQQATAALKDWSGFDTVASKA